MKFYVFYSDNLPEGKEIITALSVLPHLIVNPSFFSVFAETKICLKSAILNELQKSKESNFLLYFQKLPIYLKKKLLVSYLSTIKLSFVLCFL